MNKKEYRLKAKQTIDKLFNSLNQYESDVNKMSETVRGRYEENLQNLKRKKLELQDQYHQMAHASEERWEESKTRFNDAMSSFKEGFEKMREVV